VAKVIFDTERCKSCELCIDFCPRNVLGLSKQLNRQGFYPAYLKDPERCTGCGICARMCPDVVIEVWRDDDEKSEG